MAEPQDEKQKTDEENQPAAKSAGNKLTPEIEAAPDPWQDLPGESPSQQGLSEQPDEQLRSDASETAFDPWQNAPDDKPWETSPDDKPWETAADDKPWESEAVYDPWQSLSNNIQTIPDEKPWEQTIKGAPAEHLSEVVNEKPWEQDREPSSQAEKSPGQPDSLEAIAPKPEERESKKPLASEINLKSKVPAPARKYRSPERAGSLKKIEADKTKLALSAAKAPTDEATLHLQQLLDTVGDAGLREAFELPDDSELEEDFEYLESSPLRLDAEDSANSENSEYPESSETTQASESPSSSLMKSRLYPEGLPEQSKSPEAYSSDTEFRWKAREKSGSSTAALSGFQSKKDPFQIFSQTFDAHETEQGAEIAPTDLVSALGSAGIEEAAAQENKEPEQISAETKLEKQEAAQVREEAEAASFESFSKRAFAAGLRLDERLSPQNLEELSIMLPDEQSAYKMSLREFASSTGLAGEDKISYYELVFLTSDKKNFVEEALEGLKDEVRGNNPGAAAKLQELAAIKIALELKAAENIHDREATIESLCRLVFLEKHSKLAAVILQGEEEKQDSKPHEFSLEARKAAADLKLAQYKDAIEAVGLFLSRERNLSAEQKLANRAAALASLKNASEKMLEELFIDDYWQLHQKLSALNAIMSISETSSPKLAKEQLNALNSQPENKLASSFLLEIDSKILELPGVGRLAQVEADLQHGGMIGLRLLKQCLPTINEELDKLRLEQILEGLKPDSSSAEFQEASKRLNKELRHGNELAGLHLKWTRTGETVSRIGEAIRARNLSDLESIKSTANSIKTEMDRLSQLSSSWNDAARNSLFAMLVSGADIKSHDLWRRKLSAPAQFPDLSMLSQKEKSILQEHAAYAISETLQNDPESYPLKAEEAQLLGAALASATQKGEKNLQKAIESIFKEAIRNRNRAVAINGLIEGGAYDTPDSSVFCALLLEAAFDEGFTSSQRQKLASLAKENVEAAIRLLASIAAGALHGKLADFACEDLAKAASLSSNRDGILNVLLSQYLAKGDKESLLACIGEIAAASVPAKQEVIDTLRNAFERSSKLPFSQEYRSASKGFLALARSFKEREIEAIANNLRPEILAMLPDLAGAFSFQARKHLLNLEHEILVKGKAEDRLSAMQVISAMAKFASVQLARDLAFFASEKGRCQLKRIAMPEDSITKLAELSSLGLKAFELAQEERERFLKKDKSQAKAGPEFQEALEALDARAEIRGDSLHPHSKGYDSCRQLYESKLLDGFMTTAQVDKLLSLPLENRKLIESMLKAGDLSKDAFAFLMQIDNEKIDLLFSIPPKLFAEILLPALLANLVDTAIIEEQQLLQLPEAQRLSVFGFIEIALADRRQYLKKKHLLNFLKLSPQAQLDFLKTMQAKEELSPLTSDLAALALSAPTRNISGRTVSDAATLGEALQKKIFNEDAVRAFSMLDETARAGFSGLLKAEIISSDLATIIFEKLANEELSSQALRDLGVASLLGWLPEGLLAELLAKDPAIQQSLFERLASEAPQGKPDGFSIQDFLQRLILINDWRLKGLINKPAMQLLSNQHGSDLLIMNLLKELAEKPEKLIAPEVILQLIVNARTNKISADSLETYRQHILNESLDNQTLRKMLMQRPDIRQKAEILLRTDAEKLADLCKHSKFAEINAMAMRTFEIARTAFPDLFPQDGKFEEADSEGLSADCKKALARFYEGFRKKDYQGACQRLLMQLDKRELQSQLGSKLKIIWIEKRLSLYELNDPAALAEMNSFIMEQNKAVAEESDSDQVMLAVADPVIDLGYAYEFRLRDTRSICDDGFWRSARIHELSFLESIQNSEPAKAIFGKIGLQLVQDWLAKEVESKAKAEAETRLVNVRNLQANNFSSIASGFAKIKFPNGLSAQIPISPEAFSKLESAYNQFMILLRNACNKRGQRRVSALNDLLSKFDRNYAPILDECGIKVKRTTQSSYLIPVYDIELASRYFPPASSKDVAGINLNLQQGLRRFLLEHANGKQIYEELSRIKYSGITPKYDPHPLGRRPAAINPSDQRPLSNMQKSAFAQAVLSDCSGLYQGSFQLKERDSVKACLEMSIFKNGYLQNKLDEAFDRAEQWTHLMYYLNDRSPISAGGTTAEELYELGEFNDLHCDRDTLLMENDFVQTLLEFGIKPEQSVFEATGFYRQEIDNRLRGDSFDLSPQGQLLVEALAAMEEAQEPAAPYNQARPVRYNDENYGFICQEEHRALIQYEGQARQPLPANPRIVTASELESKFKPLHLTNKIHYQSLNPNDYGVYVLTENEKGEKFLHLDWRLRQVAEQFVEPIKADTNSKRANRQLSFASENFVTSARRLFDTFMEYAIFVDGQGTTLQSKQEVVGRGEDADIRLATDNSTISKRHLQLLLTGKGVMIQDLNSTNGTFVNWRRIRPYETVGLHTHDKVNLGSVNGPELNLFCKPRESSTARNYKVMIGSKTLTPDRALTLGSLPSADVFVSNPTVSRIQASFKMTSDGRVTIKDGIAQIPSASGLVINGKEVIPGSEIELGPNDRVFTRTGVELPVSFLEKSKLITDLNSASIKARFEIKYSSLKNMSAGVDAQHGVYALNLQERIAAKRPGRSLDSKQKPKAVQEYYLSTSDLRAVDLQRLRRSKQQAAGSKLLTARGVLTDAALKQSNDYAQGNCIEDRLEDGWSSAGRFISFDRNGTFNSPGRIALTVNRAQDHVLRGVIDDCKRRFTSLHAEPRAEALTEYVRELLNPKDMTPDQLDQWYDQFCYDNEGKRILLGEFIKEGKGIASQQAALLKVLADEFPDMKCKLLRGMDGTHSWTTFSFENVEIIHDPRGRFISAVAGTEGALPKARFWQADSNTSPQRKVEIKAGDRVSYDGSSLWRVVRIENDEIVIVANGVRYITSAALWLANPDRALRIGEKYNTPRPDGMMDRGRSGWTLQSISKDGKLRLIKAALIQVRVHRDKVRPRPAKK